MSKDKKVDCLVKLFECGYKDQIIDFLVNSKIISKADIPNTPYLNELAAKIHIVLCTFATEEKITLISYDWRLLPYEYICLTISTPKEHKEFVYEG